MYEEWFVRKDLSTKCNLKWDMSGRCDECMWLWNSSWRQSSSLTRTLYNHHLPLYIQLSSLSIFMVCNTPHTLNHFFPTLCFWSYLFFFLGECKIDMTNCFKFQLVRRQNYNHLPITLWIVKLIHPCTQFWSYLLQMQMLKQQSTNLQHCSRNYI